jgi:2-keto-4-pentenoate hydratase/2-oxohepta-3-ene-1,7-dioic acid hydratase in catechol pathway
LDEALYAQLGNLSLQLFRNGDIQQEGNSSQMLMSITALIGEISHYFSLQEGDVVLTGTPAGVGPLVSGDKLEAKLCGEKGEVLLSIKSHVV